MKSESAKRATNKYNKKAYRCLSLRFRKDDPVLDMLEIASKRKTVTKNEYVRTSLFAQFEKDGLLQKITDQMQTQQNKTEE